MPSGSTASLVDLLRQYRLLEPAQLDEVTQRLHARFPEGKALARELIQRGWLTPFQANLLLQGRGQELVLGSYVLLERLGEGGMGQVFKARHRNLNRIVALKLIRQERLDNVDTARRFEREVRAAAALSHPNIVRAYDADLIGGIHLLAMEFIPGAVDLAKVVKDRGPLPIPTACDYIRQAALGLQHAYEQGMVHRDIKPHNLLVTGDGKQVKVLDMGLARLHQFAEDDPSSVVTHEGAIVGTPDYIAPEQARDSHLVDIRADLYSLGCTFYHLLTGHAPFAGGTLMEKLLKHRLDEPASLDRLRPEAAPELDQIVRRLLAKQPEERYQTPAELAAALMAFVDGTAPPDVLAPSTPVLSSQACADSGTSADTLDSAFGALDRRVDAGFIVLKDRPRSPRPQRRLLWLGAGTSACAVICVVGWLLSGGRRTTHDADAAAQHSSAGKAHGRVDAGWLRHTSTLPPKKQVEAVLALLRELNRGFDGKAGHAIEHGAVTSLELRTDDVTDLSPLAALPDLQHLHCRGSGLDRGKLSDLSPLKGLRLVTLDISANLVSDLTPLAEMPLRELHLAGNTVGDLSALKGLPLEVLDCSHTLVSDLKPLRGMRLTSFACAGTAVTDLAPLQKMPLQKLDCSGTSINDLTPLKTMPLEELKFNYSIWRDEPVVRALPHGIRVNDKPLDEFWADVRDRRAAFDAWCREVAALKPVEQIKTVHARLKEANGGAPKVLPFQVEQNKVTQVSFHDDNVLDLAPLRALPDLRSLTCYGNTVVAKLADLTPLRGLSLTEFKLGGSQVSDLTPLAGMPLTVLECSAARVSDLTPLQGLPLRWLACHSKALTDLSPLAGLPLEYLNITGTGVTSLAPLRGMPLQEIRCSFKYRRDADVLRSIATLARINGRAAATFWKEEDASQGK
jgi:serine/threonine protein kinase/Leucine-rich repeat (LRR) protein